MVDTIKYASSKPVTFFQLHYNNAYFLAKSEGEILIKLMENHTHKYDFIIVVADVPYL